MARRIWITRTEPGASATGARVRALGHEPLIAPLLAVQPLSDVVIDLAGVSTLAFTSANGVRAFVAASAARAFQVFAVGAATAKAARALGFRHVLSSDGDVDALARGIIARKRDVTGLVLHPGAVEPAGDLVGLLEAGGIRAQGLALYDTVSTPLEAQALEAVSGVDAVLLHSPRAAQALADLLLENPMPHLRALCLSQAVMKPLAQTRLLAKTFAPMPLEAALLNLIDR